MKKIAIVGAGISGLYLANLFKENPNYQVTIYEKNNPKLTSILQRDVTETWFCYQKLCFEL